MADGRVFQEASQSQGREEELQDDAEQIEATGRSVKFSFTTAWMIVLLYIAIILLIE